MKLKKMMALALSGVLAVSMLTACDTGSVNGGASSGDGGNGVVTGYSSVLAKYMEKSTKKDYVTFQDNNADAEALEDALGNRGSLLLNGNTLAPVVMPVVSPVIANELLLRETIEGEDVYKIVRGEFTPTTKEDIERAAAEKAAAALAAEEREKRAVAPGEAPESPSPQTV